MASAANTVAMQKAPHEVGISGATFQLDGKPFVYTGMDFFNVVLNPTLNSSPTVRQEWIHKFQPCGINVLRIWAQWDNVETPMHAKRVASIIRMAACGGRISKAERHSE